MVCPEGTVKAGWTADTKSKGGIVNSINQLGYAAKRHSGCVCAGFCISVRLTFTGQSG